MFLQNIFCERLKALRKGKKMSAVGLANELETTKQTISGWENAYRIPSLETTAKIADFFGVSIDYLIGRTDNPEINR